MPEVWQAVRRLDGVPDVRRNDGCGRANRKEADDEDDRESQRDEHRRHELPGDSEYDEESEAGQYRLDEATHAAHSREKGRTAGVLPRRDLTEARALGGLTEGLAERRLLVLVAHAWACWPVAGI